MLFNQTNGSYQTIWYVIVISVIKFHLDTFLHTPSVSLLSSMYEENGILFMDKDLYTCIMFTERTIWGLPLNSCKPSAQKPRVLSQ